MICAAVTLLSGPDLGNLPVAAGLLPADPPGWPGPPLPRIEVVRDGVPDGGSGGQDNLDTVA